jgi:predicted nucleotidyltransferase
MEKSPTPYPELNRVLKALVEGIQSILKDNFVGAYLQGSFAVGDFDIHSDVDFIALLKIRSPKQMRKHSKPNTDKYFYMETHHVRSTIQLSPQ